MPTLYICCVEHLLNNPVYHALNHVDSHLGYGNDAVKYFDEAVSPFAGFPEDYKDGFLQLHQMLPGGRKILYAIPKKMEEPKGWKILHHVPGLQFVFTGKAQPVSDSSQLVPLNKEHVAEMIRLTALTKPGPFSTRTIEFGNYYGIFENGRLAAMTGQRLHVEHYTEISAVCTHPDFLGKGFATTLLIHQLNHIITHGQVPFLHVREDNSRAIALYERLGFTVSRPMNFYFMIRQ